jgi:hypothetical protein
MVAGMTLPAPPTVEPDSIRAGDSAYWQISLSSYPANDGWTLSYSLTKEPTGEVIAVTSTASGSDFLVNTGPGTTQGWQPGRYRILRTVSGTLGTFSSWVGHVTILPNLALGGAGDTRSHARRVLDMIEAVMEQRASDDILDSVIEGVALRRLPIEQLLMLRDRYTVLWSNEVAAERIAQGQGNRQKIYVRITRPI